MKGINYYTQYIQTVYWLEDHQFSVYCS